MKKTSKVRLTIAAALALMLLTACGSLPASAAISTTDAEKVIAQHLGRDDIQFIDREYDDGKYELECMVDGVKYEYEIDAATGQIIDFDCDNWDGHHHYHHNTYNHHGDCWCD